MMLIADRLGREDFAWAVFVWAGDSGATLYIMY